MSEQYWFLQIRHHHGEDNHVHRTYDGAKRGLYEYVVDNWADRPSHAPESPEGLTQEAAIDAYFDDHHREGYTLESVNLLP